jgi:hypothetical protein
MVNVAQVVLGAIVVIGFFGITTLYCFKPAAFEGAAGTQLTLITGALIAAFGTIISWAFGSTFGSARKTELLAKSEPVIELKDEVKK